MTTTQEEIRGWLLQGKEEGATHLIVVCDTYDHEDYPVFVKANENAKEKADEFNAKNMQRVMEVYSLSRDWEIQLNETRAFHYD